MFSKVQERSCYKNRNIKEMVKRVFAKSHEVHHQGEKRKFHYCLAVLFLPEAEKIRPGVFRIASFTGQHLYLVSIHRATEKNTGFISVILGPGSRHWNSLGQLHLTGLLLPHPTVACCFLPVPEHRQHKGVLKQLLHYSQTRFILFLSVTVKA